MQTKNIKVYFPQYMQNNIEVIPNAVTNYKKSKDNLDRCCNIVSVGRLDLYKDHQILIRAFARLAHIYLDLKLTIYGDGPERYRLEQLISSFRLNDKIFLPGVVQYIENTLLNADLFVFPSQYEGFPNALAEAMAVGLPVIVSNCSGNIDIVDDNINGRIFPVGDLEKLIVIMKELINDLEQRKKLGNNAMLITQKFVKEYILNKWCDLIYSFS